MRVKAAGLVLFMVFIVAATLAADSGAGLRWTAPSSWKSEGERPMRLATYQVPEGGECGVYYFGQGQGGSVEANIDRWIGQFQQSKDTAKRETRTIHGLKVTTVDVSGVYTGMGGPNAPKGPPKQGYRLLGAVVEGPQGSVFMKFTGPAETVTRNQNAFEKMLSTLNAQ
jgi:hypothetical protein